jgi:hypothetical protein
MAGGGICTFIKDDIAFKEIELPHNSADSILEGLTVEVNTKLGNLRITMFTVLQSETSLEKRDLVDST